MAASIEGMPELIDAVLPIAPPLVKEGANAVVAYELDMRKRADRVNSDIFIVFLDCFYFDKVLRLWSKCESSVVIRIVFQIILFFLLRNIFYET